MCYFKKNNNEKVIERDYQQRLCLVIQYFIFVGIITFVSEALSRCSWHAAWEFVRNSSSLFLCNMLLISMLFSVIFLFKHRMAIGFHLVIMSAIFCIAHYLLLQMRGTPLIFSDINAANFGVAILLETWGHKKIIYILGIAFLIYIIGLKLVWKRVSNRIPSIFVCCSIACISCFLWVDNTGLMTANAWQQNTDYLSNGLYLNFLSSFLNSRVNTPSNYTKGTMENIRTLIEENSMGIMGEENPNIIVLQLEAWMDPSDIPGITFNQDPIPNLHALMEKYSSGKLGVNIFGGSTVNTEFEILTGLPIEYRPLGEYPYLTLLSYKTVESLPFYLNDTYTTTAIHNYYGDFYNRDKVFKNIGFERFISMETMQNVWHDGYYPSDGLFNVYIPAVLEESADRDFIYSIYVQSHGPYLSEKMEESLIESRGEFSEPLLNNIDWYANSLHSIDEYVGALIEYFENLNEPVICFIFGDHQPALELLNDDEFKQFADTYNYYEVPYVCYNNFNLEKKDENFEAYRVCDYLLDISNNSGGLVSSFHTSLESHENYAMYLELLEYDLMSGEQHIYGEEDLYSPSDMEYGLNPMVCSQTIRLDNNELAIIGSGFNEQCKAEINGKEVEVTYQDSSHLLIHADLKENETLRVYRKGLYRIIGNIIEIDGGRIY